MDATHLQDNMTTLAPELNLPPEHPLRQILDTIAAHPEVREPVLRILLTERLLALPEQVDTLTGRVDTLQESFEDFREETREQFSAVNERIDETNRSMREQFQVVNERIDESVRVVNERIDESVRVVNERIDESVRVVNERIDESVRVVNERVDESVRVVNDRIDESAGTVVRRMEGSLGRFRGESYEKKCAEKIDMILVDHFAYAVEADRTAIIDRLAQARHNGSISREEYLDGRNVDIIAQEKPGFDDAENHLAVVEVSITFNRGDLETAARRARIIERVFGLRTDAFVTTNSSWPDEVNEMAQQIGVTIIRHDEPTYVAEF